MPYGNVEEGMLHLNEGAAILAAGAGYTIADIYSFPLRDVMEECPTLLLGGFHADMIVVATFLALKEETDEGGVALFGDDEIVALIREVLEAAYEDVG